MRCNNVIKVVYRTGASKPSAKIYRFGVKVVKIDILYNHHRSQYRRLIGSRPSCFTYLNYYPSATLETITPPEASVTSPTLYVVSYRESVICDRGREK